MTLQRCAWCGTDPLYVAYHDTEWGRPEHDPRALFECLMLEAFQAGLSWITILRRREGFRAAFQGFHPEVLATWGEAETTRLLADPGIIRHRGKIEATFAAARAYLAIEAREGADQNADGNRDRGVLQVVRPLQRRPVGLQVKQVGAVDPQLEGQLVVVIVAAEAALTPEELALAERVHTGRIACELGAYVTVTADENIPVPFSRLRIHVPVGPPAVHDLRGQPGRDLLEVILGVALVDR